MDLNKDVKYVKGVGPNRVKLLNKLKIYTLKDLITYYPRNYEDRSKPKKIIECINGENSLIEVVACSNIEEIHLRGKTMYKLIVRDDTATATAIWFNQSYLKTKFKYGKKYKLYGKITNNFGNMTINSPIFEEQDKNDNTGKIIPIYPLTYQLTQNVLRKIIENGLKEINIQIEETLPQEITKKYNLMPLKDAIIQIHFPKDLKQYQLARRRLVFEELFVTQYALKKLKTENQTKAQGIKFLKEINLDDIIKKLPFSLTNAQKKVIKEIEKDMESNRAMNRLLQGDVGSGKTIVAIISAYKAIKSGYQVAVMVPTSILAVQHLESFKSILEQFNIRSELLVSAMTKKKKKEILEELKQGKIDVLIGTHALLEENVEFSKLGFVVTDEQHRFGVKQRMTIVQKGNNPDVLVMSATPIPRTLAIILYGDLDISIIDELPPNRKKIETYAVRKSLEPRINIFIKKQIDEGRQCYIVCPLVEENEEIDLKSVTKLYETYKNEIFSQYNVEYIHGKMKAKEKDEIMNRFKEKEIDILISTTVIEVGVNVPNANIMVIEDAQRFGLAQLHQLRGRVGRGEYQSYCILKYEGKSEILKKRMEIMCQTNDGFLISEKDLELRGPGDFFGTEQHGLPNFKIANLFQDIEILKQVQECLSENNFENLSISEIFGQSFFGKIEYQRF